MSVRLTIFAKGNADLRDPLHMLRMGGQTLWNGINEALRDEARDCTIRVRHETSIGFAALAAADGVIPEGLSDDPARFGPFSVQSQFSPAAFAPTNSALVLSIQPDLGVPLVRHRSLGYRLHPYNMQRWTTEQRDWMRANFTKLAPCSAAESMEGLAQVITRLRLVSEAPVLVFNFSSVTPGETMHCYQGMGDTFSQRARRFNAALVDASAELGFSIVDVDRIVAEHGARHVRIDGVHLNPIGCRLVATEVVRILDDYGLLPERAS